MPSKAHSIWFACLESQPFDLNPLFWAQETNCLLNSKDLLIVRPTNTTTHCIMRLKKPRRSGVRTLFPSISEGCNYTEKPGNDLFEPTFKAFLQGSVHGIYMYRQDGDRWLVQYPNLVILPFDPTCAIKYSSAPGTDLTAALNTMQPLPSENQQPWLSQPNVGVPVQPSQKNGTSDSVCDKEIAMNKDVSSCDHPEPMKWNGCPMAWIREELIEKRKPKVDYNPKLLRPGKVLESNPRRWNKAEIKYPTQLKINFKTVKGSARGCLSRHRGGKTLKIVEIQDSDVNMDEPSTESTIPATTESVSRKLSFASCAKCAARNVFGRPSKKQLKCTCGGYSEETTSSQTVLNNSTRVSISDVLLVDMKSLQAPALSKEAQDTLNLLAQYKLNRLARLSGPPPPRLISPRELSLFCRINGYPFDEPETNALNSEDPTSLSTIEAYQNILELSDAWIGMSDHHT
jgi:hypothetical protein